MVLKDLRVLSKGLRTKACIHKSREVFFPRSAVTQVLHELAGADQVILGFDIITLERGAPSIHGQTYYDGDLNLDTKPWSDCVTTSLELALRELERIKELSGLEPPHDDVWFAVVAIKSNEWEEMRHKNPRDKDGHFVLYVNPAKDPKP